MAFWKDRPEDDGATHASEAALRRMADTVVGDALRGLRRAVVDGDLGQQWRAQLVLELVRLLRVDLRTGGWTRLAAADRVRLRRALQVLGVLAHCGAPIPLA